jgi:hypothetical protein
MKDLYLIYINKIGTTFKGEHMFEFLFSNSIKWEWDEGWYESSVITDTTDLSPDPSVVKTIGSLKTNELDLDLVQESGVFDIYNAVEDIIALGWQKLNEEEDDPEIERIVFKFGEKKELVESKLYIMDLALKYNENKVKI